MTPGIEPPNGLGQKMGGRVAEDVERVGVVRVARGHDLDLLAVLERRAAGPARAPFERSEHRLLGELRADRARGVEPGRAFRKFEFGTVG